MLLVVAAALKLAASASACRNATFVRLADGRLLLAEQSDSSPDALRVRTLPCVCKHGAAPPPCGCPIDDTLPGALLPDATPRCSPKTMTLDPRATEPLEVLASGNLRLLLTHDARLQFVRRSDGRVMLAESVAHVFVTVNLTGQAVDADHRSLDVSFSAFDRERLFGLGQHQLAECTPSAGRYDCTNGVLGKFSIMNAQAIYPFACDLCIDFYQIVVNADLKNANHTECGKNAENECSQNTSNQPLLML
jgi:hypothetical protein